LLYSGGVRIKYSRSSKINRNRRRCAFLHTRSRNQ